MALLTKLGRSPVHQLFTAKTAATAERNDVSADEIAMQRMADETGTMLVVANQDPAPSGANTSMVTVEGQMTPAGGWAALGEVDLNDLVAPTWGRAVSFPGALRLRVALRDGSGGTYNAAGGTTLDVWIME